MALALGTNCGFVTSAPTGDPSATLSGVLANICLVQKHSLSAGTWKITEIGFWQDVATNSQCNFNVGIYSDDGGSPSKPASLVETQSTGLYVASNTAGWAKYTGLEIILSGGTYWIGFGAQDVTVDIRSNYGAITGSRQGNDTITGPTLSSPWSATGETFYDNYANAIYAVYEEYSAGGPSIPVLMAGYRRRR